MPSGVVDLIQLDAEAPPGLVATVCSEMGIRLQIHGELPPDPSAAESNALIVLGSGVPVAEGDDRRPAVLQAWIGHRIRERRPVLAIGAGAQLLAAALGARILPDGAHEFGYVDLVPTDSTATDPVLRGLGAGLPVMEWFDDAIEPAQETMVLARCLRGRVQAFRGPAWCYGLRFHPGVTTEIVRRWAALRATARNNPAVPVRIGAEIVRHQERAERFGRSIIEAWLAQVGSGGR